LLIRREDVPRAERWCVRGAAVTSPVRTALDLACRGSLVEAVVGVDALAHAFGFRPHDLVRCAYDHPGRRGVSRLPEVVGLARPGAESPMETRIRVAIVLDGLPEPALQTPVGPYRLDMAYPEHKLGVEHDGREHLDPRRALRDLDRQAYFTARGWRIVRFPKRVVLHEPARIPWTVRRMIASSGTSERSGAS
jgi:very-short-patch-repair endonuclease